MNQELQGCDQVGGEDNLQCFKVYFKQVQKYKGQKNEGERVLGDKIHFQEIELNLT